MKFKIPFLAVIIVAAICLINKDEIKNMFNEEPAMVCEICKDDCPCVKLDCNCEDQCPCPDCA